MSIIEYNSSINYNDLLILIWKRDSSFIFDKDLDKLLLITEWAALKNAGELLRANAWWLEYLDQTEELCKLAINLDHDVLELVNSKFRTFNLIMSAIERNGELINMLNIDELTDDICIESIRIWNYTFDLIIRKHNENRKEINKKIIIEALSMNGSLLEYLDLDDITEEYCKIAVNQNGISYRFVPDKFRTDELKKEAIINSKYAIEYIEFPITKEMFELQIRTHNYYNKLVMNLKKFNFELDTEFRDIYLRM